jgi:hypothetical protein
LGGNMIGYLDAGVRLAISLAIAKEAPRGPQITKEKRQKGHSAGFVSRANR